MKRRSFLWYSLLLVAGCVTARNKSSGSFSNSAEPEKLRFAATDAQGMEELQRDYETFRMALEEVLKKKIEFFPLEDYTGAVSAMQLDLVDLILIGPSEYVIAHARTNAVPVIAITRPNFRSVIIVSAKTGIKSLADLKGKKIALNEPGSTAGYLIPLKLLLDAGVDPNSDIKIVKLRDQSLQALKNGEVDAWAGSNNRYERDILAKGAERAFPLIAASSLLPNDVLIANSKLNPAFVEQIRQRLLKNHDKLISALATSPTNKKYKESRLVAANDGDYDVIREAYKAIGQGDFLQERPNP